MERGGREEEDLVYIVKLQEESPTRKTLIKVKSATN